MLNNVRTFSRTSNCIQVLMPESALTGMKRLTASLVVSILWLSATAQAQVIRGRWEKVASLPESAKINITLTTGQKFETEFKELLSDALIVNTPSGELRIAKSDVLTIVRPGRDSLRNGALIGTGIGFGAGFLGLAAFNAKATASGPIWDQEAIGYYLTAGLIGAGIGLATGSTLDAVRKKGEVLYRR